MSIRCLLGFHPWRGCKCATCGKMRDEEHDWQACRCVICGMRRRVGHKWQGCKCAICGKARDEGHDWGGCKCAICGRVQDEGHKWQGCKCAICGKARDEGHDWGGCKCAICGRVQDEGHKWQGCKCAICGKARDEGHDWGGSYYWSGCKCATCGSTRDDGHQWQGLQCASCGKRRHYVGGQNSPKVLNWSDIQADNPELFLDCLVRFMLLAYGTSRNERVRLENQILREHDYEALGRMEEAVDDVLQRPPADELERQQFEKRRANIATQRFLLRNETATELYGFRIFVEEQLGEESFQTHGYQSDMRDRSDYELARHFAELLYAVKLLSEAKLRDERYMDNNAVRSEPDRHASEQIEVADLVKKAFIALTSLSQSGQPARLAGLAKTACAALQQQYNWL